MLEDRSCLVSRGYPRTCESENSWSPYMNFRLENSKRPLENDDGEEDDGVRKCSKQSDAQERVDSTLPLHEVSVSPEGQSVSLLQEDQSLSVLPEDQFVSEDLSVSVLPEDQSVPVLPEDQSGNQRHAGDNSDSDSLIHGIGRDNSISCLIHCSRADYGSIASLNRSFRSLVRSGELYRLRRKYGMIEHWVYILCNLWEWEAFDPNRRHWMRLPMMNSNECFVLSDKESLAVGTELLVFGKEVMANVIYKYSLLTNTWSSGMRMHAPRCLFGSASLGEIAIVAGGCDSRGNALDSAELYNSETGNWDILSPMNKPRKMCSGVFMDGWIYVIGGVGSESKLLTCGEEYDLETKTWTEISNMSPVRTGAARGNEVPATAEAPPLVAVVDNELYAADHASMEVRKYDKEGRVWVTVGRLPERAASMNGWGLAFRACGHRLICIGGPRSAGEGFIEVNSWIPSEGPPEWNLLDRKQSASFVYNCAVMGC